MSAPSSDFQQWLNAANNGSKTTLRQQFELAVELYVQVHRSAKDRQPSVDEILGQIQSTPLRSVKSLVSWKGIHVGWFLEEFCNSPYLVRLRQFGCEVWFVRKVGVIVMVLFTQRLGSSAGGSFVDHANQLAEAWNLASIPKDAKPDEPTIFISYTGAYTLEHMVQALSQVEPKTEMIWIDMFCVNQFAWTGRSSSPEFAPLRQQFLLDLDGQIESIGRTALVLQSWDNAMAALKKIWLLWEIFHTAQCQIQFQVLLTLEQEQNFVDNCLESDERFGSIMNLLATTDAAKADAENDNDRQAILDRMQSFGLEGVNKMVLGVMRKWLLERGQQRVEQRRKEADGPSMDLITNLGRLLQAQGQFDEAEPLFREALNVRRERLGNDHVDTVTSVNNLASLMSDSDKKVDEQTLLREALEGARKIVGSDHHHNDLQERLGLYASMLAGGDDADSSETRLRNILEKERQTLGNQHPTTLASMVLLAGELLDQTDKQAECRDLYYEWLEGTKQVWGEEHPSTLEAMTTVAYFTRDLGEHNNNREDAERLCRRALDLQRQKLGDRHPDTLSSMDRLGKILKELGRVEEARALFLEAVEGTRESLGEEHSNNFHARSNLTILEFSQFFKKAEG